VKGRQGEERKGKGGYYTCGENRRTQAVSQHFFERMKGGARCGEERKIDSYKIGVEIAEGKVGRPVTTTQ